MGGYRTSSPTACLKRAEASLAAAGNHHAIFYALRGGIPWRLIPKDLPVKSTVFGYFCRWRDTRVFTRINHRLVIMDRERTRRDASPSAAVPDSQSVKPPRAAVHVATMRARKSKAASDKRLSIWTEYR
jgi:transposase